MESLKKRSKNKQNATASNRLSKKIKKGSAKSLLKDLNKKFKRSESANGVHLDDGTSELATQPALELETPPASIKDTEQKGSKWVWAFALPVGIAMTTIVFLFIGFIQPSLSGGEKISLPDIIKFEFKVATAEAPPPSPPKREQPKEQTKRKPKKRAKSSSKAASKRPSSRPRRSNASNMISGMRPGLGAGAGGGVSLQISDFSGGAEVDLSVDFADDELMQDAQKLLQYENEKRRIRELTQQGDRQAIRDMLNSGRVTEPKLIFQEKPVYPPEANKKGTEGWVHVRILINIEGTVDEVEIIGSQPAGVFEESVRDALPMWQFSPAKDGAGNPLEFWKEFKYKFRLEA